MKAIDLVGQRFGKLVVVSRAENLSRGNPRWNCVCDCGGGTVAQGSALRTGRHVSCGCLQRQIATKHGMEKTDTYTVWAQMKARCLNPLHRSYPGYGGRGITVCQKWMDFEGFLEDMGEKPLGKYSLDRIDNNGSYCKENCRWADAKTQANNRGTNHYFEINGIRRSLTEWAEAFGISPITVRSRLKLGWDISKALSHQVDKRKATKSKHR